MSVLISSIYFSPVKSLSFTNIKSCIIKKDLGIVNDRSFAFSRIIDLKKALISEKNPSKRKLNNFLTLKNSPVLNRYNFEYKNLRLILKLGDKELLSIIADDPEQKSVLVNKILELENSLTKPIFLLQSDTAPFFDTSDLNKVFNSISLINLNSIKDFEKKINQKIELQRFRGNFYIEGLEAWEERKWIGKIIKINNISFKVERNIPRCTAINLKPETDISDTNLLRSLKKAMTILIWVFI
ncbi:sulfurase [Candidatus Pelagibacter sp. Uisw_116]|uniref:MOSC domain-containing protein n=1 Tax=Candidatus Pelagibacter sp. Uisw_116 TaxID=3230986 RepID=UPI0039ED2ACB